MYQVWCAFEKLLGRNRQATLILLTSWQPINIVDQVWMILAKQANLSHR